MEAVKEEPVQLALPKIGDGDWLIGDSVWYWRQSGDLLQCLPAVLVAPPNVAEPLWTICYFTTRGVSVRGLARPSAAVEPGSFTKRNPKLTKA